MTDISIKAHTLIVDQLGADVTLGPETAMHSFRNIKFTGAVSHDIIHELLTGDVNHILIDSVGYGSIQRVIHNDSGLSIDYHTIVYLAESNEVE